jgi:hypothetical protein
VGLAFGGLAGDVVAGLGVAADAGESDAVDRGVDHLHFDWMDTRRTRRAMGAATLLQVTPDIPDRRRATQQKEVRPLRPTASRSQLAARSGPSPRCRTSPTDAIETASLEAVAV